MTKILLTIIILSAKIGFSQTTTDTRVFAQKILRGQVNYNGENENEFMRTLDSLFCRTKADKFFYFKTTNKIFQLSDGALSEYCSGIASKYYIEQTSEFVNNSLTLTASELDQWFEFAAFDIAADEQDIKQLPEIKKRLDGLVLNCMCDASRQTIIKKYNAILYKKIAFNLTEP